MPYHLQDMYSSRLGGWTLKYADVCDPVMHVFAFVRKIATRYNAANGDLNTRNCGE